MKTYTKRQIDDAMEFFGMFLRDVKPPIVTKANGRYRPAGETRACDALDRIVTIQRECDRRQKAIKKAEADLNAWSEEQYDQVIAEARSMGARVLEDA